MIPMDRPDCPSCGYPKRCDSQQASFTCVGTIGHRGPHWADTGTNDGTVLKWGVVARGCGAHLSDEAWCELRPPHDRHRWHGTSWSSDPVLGDVDEHGQAVRA